jgi:hypothetical protein
MIGTPSENSTAYKSLIDHYLQAFPNTPLAMLGLEGDPVELMVYALQGGAGWRVDCWGNWGLDGPGWNHQEDMYPNMIAGATALYPEFADTWKQAPVHLEVCDTMETWYGMGWTADAPDGEVYKTLQWALEQHASVLNGKSTPVPADYVAAIDEFLKSNGYRFAVQMLNHESTVTAGGSLQIVSRWANLGVAPIYLRRTLAYRLRSATREETFESTHDIRSWLPGTWDVADSFTLPSDLEPGSYELEVALVDRAGTNPATDPLPPLQLAIEGRGTDGWYALSQLEVQ